MSDEPAEMRHTPWTESLGLTMLSRGFRLAIDPRKLSIAFAALFLIYAYGRVLDGLWSRESKAVAAGGVSEIQRFRDSGFSRSGTVQWREQVSAQKPTRRGPFVALANHWRTDLHGLAGAVLSLNVRGILATIVSAFAGLAWLLLLHPFYAILFVPPALVIAALGGGAICRIAALDATRDERTHPLDAVRFAASKLTSFVAAPLLPVAFGVVLGLLLLLGGLFGSIPGLGTLLAPLFWFLALLGGLVIAALVIGLVLGWPLMWPTIAVEGSDAFDAMSRSYNYVCERIWRTLFYGGFALLYGAICFWFVKLFCRVMLFAVHFWVGLGMNLGDASGPNGASVSDKLSAMWKAPALDFSTTFYGEPAYQVLSGASRAGSWLIALWTYAVVTLVGAFLISYFHSAGTLIYLLLRRDVDATDLEEVYEEESADETAPTPAPATGEGSGAGSAESLASLPVVGEAAPPKTAGP